MSKSRARFLSELLGTTGLVKKAKSALAGADEVIDLSVLPSIPNSKLTNSSITINSSATSLGGSVTLTTANVAENTNLYYTDARADARIVNAGSANWNTAYTYSQVGHLPLAGGTLTGNLSLGIVTANSGGGNASLGSHLDLGDNQKARFGASDDLQIYHSGTHSFISEAGTGDLYIGASSNIALMNAAFSENKLLATTDGALKLYYDGSQKFATTSTGIDVTGTVTATSYSGALASSVTATTQSSSNNSTKVATTAYVDTAVSSLVDSAPGTLNTLNELAAALGDDANFSTTVTNSIATKLPLAGGTMTGALNMNSNNISGINNATAVSFLSTNGYWVGGTRRIDASGNLENIGTISSGAITSSDLIKTTSAKGFMVDSTVDMSMSYYTQVPSTSWAIFTTNNHADTILSTNLKVDTNHDIVVNQTHGNIKGSGIVFTGNGHSAGENAIAFYAFGDNDGGTAGDVINEEDWAAKLTGSNFTVSGTISSGAITSTGSGATSASNSFLAKNSSNAELLKVRDDGVVLINHNYLYVSSSGGAYIQNALRVRGIITNDGGNNLSIGSGGSDIEFNSKNFTSVGTISSGAITSTGLVLNGGRTAEGVTAAGTYAELTRASGGDLGLLFNKDTSKWLIGIDNSDGNAANLRFMYGAYNASSHPGFGSDYSGLNLTYQGRVGIGTRYPGAELEVAGTALVENAKLKAIAESNTDTAKDVFVYDTRKDSDGGAWRKRTQHTSWYNETLNTSTRGARKEFPCVAILVYEEDQLTIYDGDDPDLPMWLVINAGGGDPLYAGGTSNACEALNGEIIAGNGDAAVSGSLGHFNFIKDFAYLRINSSGAYNGTTIVNRNNAWPTDTVTGVTEALVDRDINDVAMTVLPNAPIDADTGLPVPTIAVATNGGVSVIKDDGTVVDIVSDTITHETPREVKFVDDKVFWLAGNNYDNAWSSANSVKIPSGDITTPYNSVTTANDLVSKYTPKEWNVTNHAGNLLIPINMQSPRTGALIELTKDDELIIGGEGSDDHGTVVKVVENVSDPESGMLAQIASDFNTGYQVGDIKLATLSDTDTTNVTATELITNGTTFSNTTGWSGNSATVSVSGGELVVTGTASTTQNQSASFTSFSCNVGDQFVVKFDITERTAVPSSAGIIIGNSKISANNNLHYWYPNAVGSYITNVTATSTSISIQMHAGTGVGVITKFDNISMKKAEKDRSYNSKGVEVFGTVTKTAVATGAELVGYSGFSSSNYLRQPYNSDLDFDTGSYSVMGWFKTDATSSTGIIAQLGPSDADESLCVYISPSNYGIYFDYGAGGEYGYLSQSADRSTIANTKWHHFVCHVSAGGPPKIYVDGISRDLTISANAPSTFRFDTDYVLNIGNGRGTDNNLPFDGSIALLRISATVPSAEQIKKMYNDEKHLFATNAKATIAGTSDAVTALAYDDDTELLHVGSSWGRSVFQGLNRVEYSTDVVTTAISASNGFIVEE